MKKSSKTVLPKIVVKSDEITVVNQSRTEVFKKTDDNWCPSWKDDSNIEHVKVSLLQLTCSKYTHRVCAWGKDDFGLEKDFDNELEANEIFELIAGQEVVNTEDLIGLGFYPA